VNTTVQNISYWRFVRNTTGIYLQQTTTSRSLDWKKSRYKSGVTTRYFKGQDADGGEYKLFYANLRAEFYNKIWPTCKHLLLLLNSPLTYLQIIW